MAQILPFVSFLGAWYLKLIPSLWWSCQEDNFQPTSGILALCKCVSCVHHYSGTVYARPKGRQCSQSQDYILDHRRQAYGPWSVLRFSRPTTWLLWACDTRIPGGCLVMNEKVRTEDKTTFRMRNLWLMSLYLIPLIKSMNSLRITLRVPTNLYLPLLWIKKHSDSLYSMSIWPSHIFLNR